MDDGMLNFLIDVYDERIEEIEPNDKSESNLGYQYSLIKININKLKSLFNSLERDFRQQKEVLNIESYRDLMTRIEEIIP